MTNASARVSFRLFQDSFAYGSRTDPNVKFLKGLADEDSAQLFQDLLWKPGEAPDYGDRGRARFALNWSE